MSILAFFEEFRSCLFRPTKLSNSSHLLVLFSSDVPPVASPASPVHCFAYSAIPQCRLYVHGRDRSQWLIALTLAQCTLIQRLAAMPTCVQHWRTLPPTPFFLAFFSGLQCSSSFALWFSCFPSYVPLTRYIVAALLVLKKKRPISRYAK